MTHFNYYDFSPNFSISKTNTVVLVTQTNTQNTVKLFRPRGYHHELMFHMRIEYGNKFLIIMQFY